MVEEEIIAVKVDREESKLSLLSTLRRFQKPAPRPDPKQLTLALPAIEVEQPQPLVPAPDDEPSPAGTVSTTDITPIDDDGLDPGDILSGRRKGGRSPRVRSLSRDSNASSSRRGRRHTPSRPASQPKRRERPGRRRERPDPGWTADLSRCDGEDERVWDRVMKFQEPIDWNAIYSGSKSKRRKKEGNREALKAKKAALRQEIGNDVDEDILNLMLDDGGAAQPQAAAEPTGDAFDDIFSAPTGDGGGDMFDDDMFRMDAYQLTVTEGGAGKLIPFEDAYKITYPTEWPPEDEARFVRAISMFGWDLMMVKAILPMYTEKEIKRKLNLERRKGNQSYMPGDTKVTRVIYEELHGTINADTHFRPPEDGALASGIVSLTTRQTKTMESGDVSTNAFDDLFSAKREGKRELEDDDDVENPLPAQAELADLFD